MTDDEKSETPPSGSAGDAQAEAPRATQSGPTFTEAPDPLANARKAAGDAWKNTEGRTVSLRVYIGSIIAVIVLMMLGRCGG